jgi:uncharacterized protein
MDWPDHVKLDEVVEHLRDAGARFAYLFGSWAEGGARPTSDVDVAAWFGRADIDGLTVAAGLPGPVDLLVLDSAPLELTGRVAMRGRLIFDGDPNARVAWEATTRRIYLDEHPRIDRSRADFARVHGRS